jgi:hypothetical protein
MRTLAVRAALRSALLRWGAWVLMALGLLAAVGNTPEVALAGVASLLAPLWWASGQGGWRGTLQWAGVSLLYALLGMAWLRAWRPALWPAHWRDVEATLPLPAAVLRRSDQAVLRWVLAPWAALLCTAWGLLLWWQPGPVWAQASRAAVGLLAALGTSLLVGQWGLSRWRHPTAPRWKGACNARSERPAWRRVHPVWALVLAPVWRGQAPQSRWVLSTGLLMPALALVALCVTHRWITAWLCAATTVALIGTSLAVQRLQREGARLQAASLHLPLPQSHLQGWQRALALGPVLGLVLGLAVTLSLCALPLHPLPTLGLALSLACAGGLETHWPVRKPDHHASRWLLMLCICLAFASEINPA